MESKHYILRVKRNISFIRRGECKSPFVHLWWQSGAIFSQSFCCLSQTLQKKMGLLQHCWLNIITLTSKIISRGGPCEKKSKISTLPKKILPLNIFNDKGDTFIYFGKLWPSMTSGERDGWVLGCLQTFLMIGYVFRLGNLLNIVGKVTGID